MAYTVQLSDSVTTLDLVDGVSYLVLPGGVAHGPPRPRRAMGPESLLEHGSPLVEEKFGNRQVTLRLQVRGSSKDNLIANVRNIQDLLEKARVRQITGFGNDVTLTLQWDGATNSFILDVLDGQLNYPEALWSKSFLELNTRIVDARLELLCKPFARRAPVNLAVDTLENEQDSATDKNYTDVASIDGDVDAPAEIKLVPTGAAGSAKTYIGTRSGSRRTDGLWRQGEAVSSEENLGNEANWSYAGSTVADANASDGNLRRLSLTRNAGSSQHPAEDLWSFKFDLGATFPQGLFRVLARVQVGGTAGQEPPAADMQFGAGWKFGSVTKVPASYLSLASLNAYQLLDLGEVRLPPILQPDESYSFATRELHVRARLNNPWNPALSSTATWDLDYLFLLPADEFVAIVNSVGATDRILVDSRSRHGQLYLLDGSDNVVRVADYLGRPLLLSKQGSRIYVLRDDGRNVTFAFSGKYTPRYWDLA